MAQILIIEDDPFVRRFYERLFRAHQIEVDLAESGAEGLAKAKSFHPKLIFLDILMPRMNGLEVLKALKSDPQTQRSEVIMLTNLNETNIVDEAVKNGASGFLVKSDMSDDQLVTEAKTRLNIDQK